MKNHGGHRFGAGRKPNSIKKVLISLRISENLKKWIDEQENNNTSIIVNAIIDQYHLDKNKYK